MKTPKSILELSWGLSERKDRARRGRVLFMEINKTTNRKKRKQQLKRN